MGNSLSLQRESNNPRRFMALSSSRLNLLWNNINFRRNNQNNSKKELNNISFSSHFIIAGRRFKNVLNQTQTFLFGDHLDLSFILAHKPVMFPYETPLVENPSKYLQSLVNIRKDTIKLVKVINDSDRIDLPIKYNIEFRFDCDCDVHVKIYYFATEKFVLTETMSNNNLRQLVYTCNCANNVQNKSKNKCLCLNDDSNVYQKGANLLFQNQNHTISPSQFDFKAWQFNVSTNYFPIVIECTPINQQLASRHAHVTLACIDKSQIMSSPNSVSPISNIPYSEPNNKQLNALEFSSSMSSNNVAVATVAATPLHTYQIKPIKQKQVIDGVLYSLQEIYGIEKKITPDIENNKYNTKTENSQSSVSGSNTSSSIATQNSNLTSGTSDIIESGSGSNVNDLNDYDIMSCNLKQPILVNNKNSNVDTIGEKRRQLEQEIEQEMKGIECVICMCETRDTLILPCRHLCLCKLCAINLRVQSNNCPICRIPFIALLQLKLVKKKDSENMNNKSLKQDDPEKNLPIVRILENQLPIVKIENPNNTHSLDVSHENVITEENFEVEVLSEKSVYCMSTPEINDSNGIRLLDKYEIVTIYEAFNENKENQNFINSHTITNDAVHGKFSNRSKRFKIKILDPIRSSSDFVIQNVNEVETHNRVVGSENTIPKLFDIQNISNQIETFGLRPMVIENDLRCSSVVLNKTIGDQSLTVEKKIFKSASFIDNFRQLNKLNESIQMDEVQNNTTHNTSNNSSKNFVN